MSFKISPEYAILGILMAGPKHGYELHGYINSKMSQFWQLNMSQVYALLKRMERNAVVVSDEESQENRPPKKIFSLTQKGKQRFVRWVHSPVEHVRDIRMEFMAKLYFVMELQLEGGVGLLIDKQVRVVEEKLRVMESPTTDATDDFQAVLHSFKTTQTAAVLDWLNECKASFSKGGEQ
jgi:DNA-binding PadR family transcriptional regulator